MRGLGVIFNGNTTGFIMRSSLPLLLFFLFAGSALGQTWSLSWSDEFNGTSIDNSKWGYDIGTGAAQGLWGWGNGELQYYTDNTDNADVVNGNLVITARQENFAGSDYTSARMVTRARPMASGRPALTCPLGKASGRHSGCCARTTPGRARSTSWKS